MSSNRVRFLAVLGLAVVATVQQASAQCIGGGTGGALPASGTGGGGVFPGTLPGSPFSSTLAVTVPAGATVLKSVKLNGVTHTWSGDMQFVLQDPAGGLHNLLCGMPTDPLNDFGGDYELVDPIQTAGCSSTITTFNYANGDPILSGIYGQNFGGHPSGTNGINNTPIEQIPISSGNWTLYGYDWVGGDTGTLTSWELCFGTPTPPPPPPPGSGVCIPNGPGGAFPVGGADGTWPTTMPTGELISNLVVALPAGATKIKAVKLNGFGHTWSGDAQIVLQTPAGTKINLFQQVDGVFGGGCADDFAGDYIFVDSVVGTSPCGGPASTFTCGYGGAVPTGAYLQYFGLWNSGDNGIFNTPLESVPVASGTYTLLCYDWFVGADDGALASWEICFDGASGPVTYCTSGTSTNGCVPAISATGTPSVAASSGFSIDVANVEGQKSGLIFYGISGQSAISWATGSNSFLCVKPPTQRMTFQTSGGSVGQCNGNLTQDFLAFVAANPAALGAPFSAGVVVDVQAWYRDPAAAKTTNLSGGLEFVTSP